MKKYTIGALISFESKEILLINKLRPKWQEGKLNFPGGHIEDGETSLQCISREFKEETNLKIPETDWKYIGKINSEGNYFVDFFATTYKKEYGVTATMTDEFLEWVPIWKLPSNCISNLHWLIPFAVNCIQQGNIDSLKFGLFEYH